MLNKKIEEAINAQINAEMWSAYLYLSMAAHCHANGNPGMGNWFEVQFQEEQDHAKILFNYVIQRGGRVELKPIDAVPTEWKSPLDVFESTLAHEQKVTALINNLFALSTAENDYATQSMLKWFVDEQVDDKRQRLRLVHARQRTRRTHLCAGFSPRSKSITTHMLKKKTEPIRKHRLCFFMSPPKLRSKPMQKNI